VFAIGFVAFGVGTGVSGASLGDFFRDIFGGGSDDAPAIADALEAVEDNPNDAAAVLDLANAYREAGQNRDAAETLEKYVALEPTDAAALRQLTALYLRLASQTNQDATVLIASRGSGGSFSAQAFSFPGGSGFIGALGENPVEDAVDSGYTRAATQLSEEARQFHEKRVAAFEKLAAATPEDATVLYQLAGAASAAGETDKAIDALERYLEADPDGEYAASARAALDELTGTTDTITG
jgi:tetratricopeptide (TPR) repeat protein